MKNIRIILFFCVFMTVSVYNVFSLPQVNSDTLFFTNKKGDVMSKNKVTNIFNSRDYRAIADIFYNTGYVLANRHHLYQDSLHKSFIYFEYATAYYDSAGADLELALSVEHQATISYMAGEKQKAIQLYQKALQKYESLKVPDYKQIASLHTNIALIFFNSYRYMHARRFFTTALSLYKKINLPQDIAESLYYIGLSFYETEVYDSAYVYYMKALEYDKKTNNVSEIVASYNNICVVMLQQKKYKQAFNFLAEADPLADSVNNPRVKAIHYNNKGNARFYAEEYDKAFDLYTYSLRIKKEINDTIGQSVSLHNMARVFLKRTQYERAVDYIHQSLDYFDNPVNSRIYAEICKTASDIYEKLGNDDLALEYYEKYVSSSFSVLSQDVNQITESHIKYQDNRIEASSIEREIKMQKLLADYDFAIKQTEIQTGEQERKAQQMMLYSILGMLFFVLLAGILIYNRYRIKKQASRKLEKQNKELEKQNAVIEEQSNVLMRSNQEFEKLSIVASNTDNAIIIMDSQGNFEWINDAFVSMFGYNLDELSQRISSNIISSTTPEYIKNAFETCVRESKTVTYDLQTTTKSGEQKWVNVTLSPILNDAHEITKLVMIDADITDLKNAEIEIKKQKKYIEQQKEEFTQQRDEVIEQGKVMKKQKEELSKTLHELQSAQSKLVESEKMAALGSLVAGISHEINTPVGIGSAAATTLLSRTKEISELFNSKKLKLSDLKNFIESAEQACELIRKNLTRTADLIKSFNKVSVDNISEEKRVFNLCEYIDDIVRSLSPKFKGRKVSLNIDCPENIDIVSYPGAFAQIFTNFIINSLIHAFDEEEKGDIFIRVSESDTELICVYSDNGKGISPEYQDKVFDAFFTTNSKVGTGLGMSITYNLITQKLGGTISLESEIDKGVSFIITIPLEQLKED
ncbi:MAG: tetratricopeptide repeat protein [Bacteroidales bacterium]